MIHALGTSGRNAFGAPLVHSGGKSFLGRFFGQIKVADEPDQRGDDPSPIRTIDGVYSRIGIYGHLAKIPEEGPDIRCK